MAHQPYLTMMQLLLDGELAAETRRQLEEHLAICRQCQASWAGLSALERMFNSAPMLAPRAGFNQRFNARLAQRRSRPRLIWGGLALGLGAIGVSALVVPLGVGLILSLLRLAQEPATALAVVSSLDATAGIADTLLDALYIAGRAVLNGTAFNPLTWAGGVLALALAGVWLYVMQKITLEGSTQ